MFKYEPYFAHTSRTFNARMDERMRKAKILQEQAGKPIFVGSVYDTADSAVYPEDSWAVYKSEEETRTCLHRFNAHLHGVCEECSTPF